MVTLTRTLVMLRGGRQGWPRPRPRPSAEGGPGWCRCRTVCWGRDGTPPMPGRGRGWTRWPGLFRYYLPGAECTLTKQNYKFLTCRAYKTLKEKLPNNEKIISKKQIVDQVNTDQSLHIISPSLGLSDAGPEIHPRDELPARPCAGPCAGPPPPRPHLHMLVATNNNNKMILKNILILGWDLAIAIFRYQPSILIYVQSVYS